jgi:hypothetical protein
MNFNTENQFTFNPVSDEFVLFCRAELPECGNILSLSAPCVECGILLSVTPDGSVAYTVTGSCDYTVTVNCFFPVSARTGIVSCEPLKPRRVHSVQRMIPLAFRKTTFLRL